jgi:hypothetical protein
MAQLFFIAISVVLGGLMMIRRLDAQEPKDRGRMGAGRSLGLRDAGPEVQLQVTDAGAAPQPTQAPAQGKAKDKDDKADKEKDGGEDQIETAVLGPDGGVPIHVEGHYRSPFANPYFGEVATVRVGLVLNDIEQYDIMKGSFQADFYLSLTSDRPMPSMDLIFPNGKADSKEVIADRPTFKFYRFTGTFTKAPDLRTYPFDSQILEIGIEENTEGIDQIRLIPDQAHTNLEEGFDVIGWDVGYVEARTYSHNYPDRFDDDDLYYSRYVYRLGIDRYGTSAIFTVYVPAIVIVIISRMGIWVPQDEMEVRSNSQAPMLAAAVLFHFALMQQLPAVSYLTRADKLMIGVYISLLLGMLSTWCFFLVQEHHRDKVFIWARRIVPPVTVALMVYVCVV